MDLDLWQRCRGGDRRARAALIERYRPLATSASRRRVPKDPLLEREDLESAALVGLIEAIDRFESDRGIPFEAFAQKRIRGAVVDEVRRCRGRGDRRPDGSADASPSRVCVSLDHLSEQGAAFVSAGELDPRFDRIEARDRVDRSLSDVSPRQRELLSHYYGDGLTLREAGTRMGITEARASQLRSRAIEHMRAAMLGAAT